MNTNSKSLLQEIRTTKPTAIKLLSMENEQSQKLDQSAAELTDSIENENDEKIIKNSDTFKQNLALQYTIGLHANDLKPTTTNDRYRNLFDDEGIETEFMQTGEITFIYVPKVNVDGPELIDNIALFYVKLSQPENDKRDHLLRTCFIKIFNKQLPDSDEKKFSWAVVEQGQRHETINMGEFINIGRIIGKGQYTMMNTDSHHTILHYVLEPCSDIGHIQWTKSIITQPAMLNIASSQTVWIPFSIGDFEKTLDQLDHEIREPDSQ